MDFSNYSTPAEALKYCKLWCFSCSFCSNSTFPWTIAARRLSNSEVGVSQCADAGCWELQRWMIERIWSLNGRLKQEARFWKARGSPLGFSGSQAKVASARRDTRWQLRDRFIHQNRSGVFKNPNKNRAKEAVLSVISAICSARAAGKNKVGGAARRAEGKSAGLSFKSNAHIFRSSTRLTFASRWRNSLAVGTSLELQHGICESCDFIFRNEVKSRDRSNMAKQTVSQNDSTSTVCLNKESVYLN